MVYNIYLEQDRTDDILANRITYIIYYIFMCMLPLFALPLD